MNDITEIKLVQIYPTLSEKIRFLVTNDYEYDKITSSQKEILVCAFLQDTDYEDLYTIMESVNLRRGLIDLFHVGINCDLMKFEVKQQIMWKFSDVFRDLFLIHKEEYEQQISEGLAEEYLG